MFRIAICDDLERDLEEICRKVLQFRECRPQWPLQIEKFQSVYDLLDSVNDTGGFDIYLLDILMPSQSGLELAKKLKGRKETCEIIFITTSREFGVDAFEAEASGYLVKPISEESLFKCLEKAMVRLAPKENPWILLKTKTGIRKIDIKDILYVESVGRRRVINLLGNEAVATDQTLASLWEMLGPYPGFLSPHRSFIVNMEYISGLGSAELLMANGQKIPVSRKCYGQLKKTFISYMF